MVVNQEPGTAELLFVCAQQMGLKPVWIKTFNTFVITVDGQERYISLARSPLNSDTSVGLVKDKYITRCILERHNMQNIPFALPSTQTEAEMFLRQHKKIIAKPVTGAGARDIHVVTTSSYLKTLNVAEYILEKYISGKELRYLLLNGKVIGVHRSDYGTSVAADRSLQRISYPEVSWEPALIESSLRVASIFNLTFAAVDYLVDTSGRSYVLEINTMPGLKWFHTPSSGPIVDVARLFLQSVINGLRTEMPFAPRAVALHPARAYSRA